VAQKESMPAVPANRRWRAGETAFCTGENGALRGPFAVQSVHGSIAYVRAPGGTLIALPTRRLRPG
jgi:hypothetical protein